MPRFPILIALLGALASCTTVPEEPVKIAPRPGPARKADQERRVAELQTPTFGTNADRQGGVPLPVPSPEPAVFSTNVASSLPPIQVSPDAITLAGVNAYNAQTREMISSVNATLPPTSEGADGYETPQGYEPIASQPIIPADTSAVASDMPAADTTAIAAFALATDHGVGTKMYDRRDTGQAAAAASCARYRTDDEAQRAFLAVGGPNGDPLGLDPDGDGFACGWSPVPFRNMVNQ
jgi:hypothetical protein